MRSSRKAQSSIIRFWDDLQFDLASGKVPGANAPTWEALTTNNPAYSFTVNDYINLKANEPSHKWQEGSTGSIHLHIAPKTDQVTGSNRYAKFTVYISYANVGAVWAETSLSAEYTIPTGTLALTHLLLPVGDLSLAGNGIGVQIKATVKRIAATGGTEYADNVFVTQCGIHLQEDTPGSKRVSAK